MIRIGAFVAGVLLIAGCSVNTFTRVHPVAQDIQVTRVPENVQGGQLLGTTRLVFTTSPDRAEVLAKHFTQWAGGNVSLIRVERWWGFYNIYALDAYRM